MGRFIAAGLAFCLCANVAAFAQTGGEISGRLTAADGTPAAGVRVSAVDVATFSAGQTLPIERTSIVETASDGRYRIENLSPGRYYVAAGRIDFPTYYPGALGQDEAIALAISAGTTIPDVNFTITRESSGMNVRGRAIFDSRLPLTIPPEAVLNRTSTNEQLSAHLADNGSFEFRHVPPGSYNLGASLIPYWVPSLRLPITVTDKDISGVELKVPMPVTVVGRIFVDEEAPQPSFMLSLQSESGSTTANANFRPDGSFVLVLPEGEYRAVPQGFPSIYRVESLTYGEADLLRQPMKIGLGDNNSLTVRFSIPKPLPWRKIRGRVVGAEYLSPVQGHSGYFGAPQIVLTSDPPLKAPFTAPVRFDGPFEFSDVLPGKYTVSISTMPESAVSIVVSDSDIDGLQLVIPPKRALEGRIVVEDGAVLPQNATNLISAISVPGSKPVWSEPRPDGAFTLELPDGEYDFRLNWLPESFAVKSMFYGLTDILNRPLKIRGPMPEPLVVTVVPIRPLVKVVGRVINAGRIPSATAAVELAENSSNESFRLVTPIRPDGSFDFANVPPGTYRVSTQPYVSGTAASFVHAVQDVRGLEIIIPTQRTIDVRVVVDAGPIPALSFDVDGLYPGTINQKSDGTFSLILPEGERNLRLRSVPLGYELKALTAGASDLLKEPLRVGESGPNEIQVRLATTLPLVRIRGRTGDVVDGQALLRGFSAELFLQAPVAADGSFEFSGVPAGVYEASLLSYPSRSFLVTARKDVDDLEIDLDSGVPEAKHVRGRVVVDGDGPPPPFSLSIRSSAGFDVYESPRPDGRFTRILPKGRHRVRAKARPEVLYELKSMTYGTADLLKEPLIIDDQDSGELVLTFSINSTVPRAKVKGRVIGAENLPVMGGTLRMVFLSGDTTQHSSIDADGNFEFTGVLPGFYTLRTLLPWPAVPVVATGKDVTGIELTVPPPGR